MFPLHRTLAGRKNLRSQHLNPFCRTHFDTSTLQHLTLVRNLTHHQTLMCYLMFLISLMTTSCCSIQTHQDNISLPTCILKTHLHHYYHSHCSKRLQFWKKLQSHLHPFHATKAHPSGSNIKGISKEERVSAKVIGNCAG